MIYKFEEITREEIIGYLNESDPVKIQAYLDEADRVKVENIGSKVFLRGLIELSNICVKNCYYCGIRHDNNNLVRYELLNLHGSHVTGHLYCRPGREATQLIQGELPGL